MAHFNVFLDTNIFISAKYNFEGGALNSLKKHCENGTVALYTNDIILREVLHHIDSDVDMLAKQAKNSIKNHRELVNAITQQTYKEIEATLLDAPKRLAIQFETFMRKATVIPNAGLSMVELFDHYFANTAPFENREKKKSEFPDAVAIMSIRRYVEETTGVVLHVVTDDDGWHAALKGISRINVYKDLKTLLTQIAKEEELYVQIAQYMGEHIENLQPFVESWFFDQDWSTSVDNIELCIECDEIDDMHIAEVKLVPDGVEFIDRDAGCAVATFSGIARVHLGFSYTDHTHETYDREDHVWLNTIYGKGVAEVEIPFSGSVAILISEDGEMEYDSTNFDKIDLGAIESIEYELTPYREDDNPYFDTCPDCGNPIGIHNDGGNGFCIDCASRH